MNEIAICRILDLLEKTINKGGDKRTLQTLKKKVEKLKKELLILTK
tara:strand:+ start:461 stop:598 length:138 start_codon:yes stop_codon:yes gene_type:complete